MWIGCMYCMLISSVMTSCDFEVCAKKSVYVSKRLSLVSESAELISMNILGFKTEILS